MKRTQGTMARAISGGIAGSAIVGAAAVVEGGADKLGLGIVVGGVFGLIVGAFISVLLFTRIARNPLPYFLVGAIIGALTVAVITNLDSEISVGDVIASTYTGLASGAVIGGLISVLISRRLGGGSTPTPQ